MGYLIESPVVCYQYRLGAQRMRDSRVLLDQVAHRVRIEHVPLHGPSSRKGSRSCVPWLRSFSSRKSVGIRAPSSDLFFQCQHAPTCPQKCIETAPVPEILNQSAQWPASLTFGAPDRVQAPVRAPDTSRRRTHFQEGERIVPHGFRTKGEPANF